MPSRMRMPRLLPFSFVILLGVLALAQTPTAATPTAENTDFSGLWKAKRRFGRFAQARILVFKYGEGYRADMLGWSVPVRSDKGGLSFALPDGQGSFRGRLDKQGNIEGHWTRPGVPSDNGVNVSPVLLKADGPGRWTVDVRPLDDTFTLYLLLQKEGPHSWTAVLRNPERDFGTLWRISKLVRDGSELKLMGQFGGKEAVIAKGSFDPEREAITLVFANRGGSYDFAREDDESAFYPRGRKPAQYVYHPPPARDDGWPTGALEAADINQPAIERFIQRLLDTSMDSTDAPQFHAVLIARHGKLVLEEYFHGEHRDKPHQTRSASKSITAVLVGAVINNGAPLSLSSPVYLVMNNGAFPAGLDPQKRSMTLEHLLTMSAGYFCDDTNEQAPGNEDKMWEQTQESDFNLYTLMVPLATPPGENSVYCSASANLALGMVGRATRESPLYSFDRLIARPMKIGNYVWWLDRAGNPYGGGCVLFLPRDFLKFGQLMLNGGSWEGRHILSRDFVRQSISPQYHLRRITYGYLWWVEDLPYKDRKVRAFLSLGAGGQYIIGIPELDLVIALQGANYGSRTQGRLREAIPRYILPAVREPGDDKNAPVVEQEYTNPYGRSDDGSRVRPTK